MAKAKRVRNILIQLHVLIVGTYADNDESFVYCSIRFVFFRIVLFDRQVAQFSTGKSSPHFG